MELRNVHTFIRVVEYMNFTKAAETLGYTQATVTMQIKQLETELGVRLFDRIGRSISLTSDGETFLPHARALLRAEEEAVASVGESEEPHGRLRIGAGSSLATGMLPKVLAEYNRKYPKVQVSVTVSDVTEDQLETLRKGQLDFLLELDEPLVLPDCTVLLSKEEKIVLVTGSDNPLLKKKNPDQEEIFSQKFAVIDRDGDYCGRLKEAADECGMELDIALEVSSMTAVIRLLKESNYVSYTPYFMVEDDIKQGRLSVLGFEFTDSLVQTQLLHHRDKWMNPQMKAFADLLAQELR